MTVSPPDSAPDAVGSFTADSATDIELSRPRDTAPLVMEIGVVIPTLNERGNIDRLMDSVLEADPRLHIIVVDDGSSDGTGVTVAQRASGDDAAAERVHLIERGGRFGYASAVQDGMRYALRHGARLVLQMDADFSHDPSYIPQLLRKSDQCDLVIGSRYVPGGGTRNWGWSRKILSGGANALARTLLRLPIRDCTGGFRCWRRELLEQTGVLTAAVQGYAFLFVTLNECHRRGARIGEVPIIFADRENGKSKMSHRIIFEAVRVLFALSWHNVWSRRRAKQD